MIHHIIIICVLIKFGICIFYIYIVVKSFKSPVFLNIYLISKVHKYLFVLFRFFRTFFLVVNGCLWGEFLIKSIHPIISLNFGFKGCRQLNKIQNLLISWSFSKSQWILAKGVRLYLWHPSLSQVDPLDFC